jgi:hypothetical protein
MIFNSGVDEAWDTGAKMSWSANTRQHVINFHEHVIASWHSSHGQTDFTGLTILWKLSCQDKKKQNSDENLFHFSQQKVLEIV